MKRFIALLMAAIMVLSMAACQNNDTTTTTPDPAPAPSDTTPPADPQQTQDNAETIIESKEYLKT